jgi:hypothetical protein
VASFRWFVVSPSRARRASFRHFTASYLVLSLSSPPPPKEKVRFIFVRIKMFMEIVLIIITIIQFLRFILEAGRYVKDYNYQEEEMTEEARRMFS